MKELDKLDASPNESTSRRHNAAIEPRRFSKKVNGPLALGVLLVAVMGLSGCVASANTGANGTTLAGNSQTGTPRPSKSATPPASAPVTAGSVVKQHTKLPDGQRAYPLADGTYVVVQQDKPLPPAVRADLDTQVQTKIQPTTSIEKSAYPLVAAKQFLDNSFAGTGRYAIVIMNTATSDSNGRNLVGWVAMSSDPGLTIGIVNSTEAATQATVQTWINAQAEPGRYDIFVR